MRNPVIVKTLRDMPAWRAGDDTLLREVLHPDNDPVHLPFSLAHALLKPGESSRPHRLSERDEIYIILGGEGTLYLDEVNYPVVAGSVVLIPAGTVQWLANEGDTDLELYCIVQPPWKKEDEEVGPDNTGGL
jgi:mannose-6-phosphate isomerase-like protein (cupin superfamily)